MLVAVAAVAIAILAGALLISYGSKLYQYRRENALVDRATALLEQGELSKAALMARELLTRHPDSLPALSILADTAERQNLEEAVLWRERIARLRPMDLESQLNFASAALRFGKSVGSPTDGHLVGGERLEDTSYVKVMAHDAPGDVRWGLSPLVSMIDRAARTVTKKFPGSVLEVGHLSRSGGGDVGDHASHESGRDADLAFYVKNSEGKQVFSDSMVKFAGDGTASTWPGARFDDARNWTLISSIVQDNANVTHIFVSSPLRARLLAYAAKVGAPESVRARAAELMMQPHGSLPHDDHFHVRIGCPAGQRACIENPAPRKKMHITHVPTPKHRERTEPPAPPTDHVKTDAPSRAEPQPAASTPRSR